ncbi:hypothetical protein M433DRAFT_286316 [Acidomyces richmondensis BFW]|nr:MAG: hypothetical protein FE78DRAFT_372300 [Acidomyces sp. 'richmondensis']KYG44790.1 hypothetical protein M433DRAFT_286316 [Acidomyces richmondensis BFW]
MIRLTKARYDRDRLLALDSLDWRAPSAGDRSVRLRACRASGLRFAAVFLFRRCRAGTATAGFLITMSSRWPSHHSDGPLARLSGSIRLSGQDGVRSRAD